MHLILTGATGLVGSGVLHYMLVTPSITQISILSRRPVPQAQGHAKAKVIIHDDYTSYPPSLLEQLKGAEGVVWAQGISQNAVDKEQYIKITTDYPLAAAKAFATLNSPKPFKFVYVSGEGATTTPGTFTARFALYKGIAESTLLAMSKDPLFPLFRPYSARPGGVDSTAHTEIQAFVSPRTGMERLGAAVFLPLGSVWKGLLSPTRELGKVLTELAMGDGEPLAGQGIEGEGRTVRNSALRAMAGI